MSGKGGTNSVISFSIVGCFVSIPAVVSGVISTRGRGLRAIFVALLWSRKLACSPQSLVNLVYCYLASCLIIPIV